MNMFQTRFCLRWRDCNTVEPLMKGHPNKRPHPSFKTTFSVTFFCIFPCHHHDHHLSLDHERRWGTKNDFVTSFLHFSLFSTALWDLVNSRPLHSLMLSSHFFLCLPCLLPPFTMPCKMLLARPCKMFKSLKIMAMSAATLHVAVNVCHVINKAIMCGTSIYYTMRQPLCAHHWQFSSVQFSPLTDWVIRGTWGAIQQRSSSSLFCITDKEILLQSFLHHW